MTRKGVDVRARKGYWAYTAEDAAKATAPKTEAPSAVTAALNEIAAPTRGRSARFWIGSARGENGRTRVTFVWEPAAAVPGEVSGAPAARVELTATGEDDGVMFEGAVLPVRPGVLNGAAAEPSRAVFDVAPGRMRLRMTIQDGDRRSVDFDVRDFLVRDLRGKLNMGTPEILRARNAREFRLIETSPQAVPVSSREFSRAERLLIRFPIYAPAGQPVTVRATLLNRAGQPMRTIDVQPSPMTTGEQQIDLALAGLPTGDYFVDIVVTGGKE